MKGWCESVHWSHSARLGISLIHISAKVWHSPENEMTLVIELLNVQPIGSPRNQHPKQTWLRDNGRFQHPFAKLQCRLWPSSRKHPAWVGSGVKPLICYSHSHPLESMFIMSASGIIMKQWNLKRRKWCRHMLRWSRCSHQVAQLVALVGCWCYCCQANKNITPSGHKCQRLSTYPRQGTWRVSVMLKTRIQVFSRSRVIEHYSY